MGLTTLQRIEQMLIFLITVTKIVETQSFVKVMNLFPVFPITKQQLVA